MAESWRIDETYAHGGLESRRNCAGRPCSNCIRIPDESPARATASFPGSQEPMGHLVAHENTRCPQCTLQADKAEIALNHREIDEFVAGPPHNCSEHEEYGPFMWSRVIVGGMESSCRC
jgi:hypothetical protein